MYTRAGAHVEQTAHADCAPDKRSGRLSCSLKGLNLRARQRQIGRAAPASSKVQISSAATGAKTGHNRLHEDDFANAGAKRLRSRRLQNRKRRIGPDSTPCGARPRFGAIESGDAGARLASRIDTGMAGLHKRLRQRRQTIGADQKKPPSGAPPAIGPRLQANQIQRCAKRPVGKIGAGRHQPGRVGVSGIGRLKSGQSHKPPVGQHDLQPPVDADSLHGLCDALSAGIGRGGRTSQKSEREGERAPRQKLFIQARCAKQITLRKKGPRSRSSAG